jgi:hypothetical protein
MVSRHGGGGRVVVLCVALGSWGCGSPPVEGESEGAATSTSTAASASSSSGGADGATTRDEPTGGGGTAQVTSGPTDTSAETAAPTVPGETGDETTSTSSPSGPDETTSGSSSETTSAVDDTGSGTSSSGGGESSSDAGDDTSTGGEPNPLMDLPNLWYSVDKSLMYIELSPVDGSVVGLVHNPLMADEVLFHGQNGLTMLEGGALLGSRESANGTQIFHVPAPPITADTPAQAVLLGVVPNDGQAQPIRVEALYTDCDGRVYLMDTGENVTNSIGNRLLRFTGDYLAGDLEFEVITDLQNASVGDIDDMSPGIVNGEVNDSLGFAMDTSALWQLDYTTGTGMQLAVTAGTFGIHALGGPLFDDGQPRLYVLSSAAGLFVVSLGDFSSSESLVVGPSLMQGPNGWSGLAGPLTECMTTIPQ